MNISDLNAFVTVAEAGSFSRAAEALYLTQPAVSKRIAALEQSLGCRLFDRIGRTTVLTEAGRALLRHAHRILAEVEDSRRAIANLQDRITGHLKLATSHHIGLHRLPRVLRRFIHAFPDVELDLDFMDSEQACRAVERGDQELALITLPPRDATPLDLIEVWHDRLVLATSAGHPLAAIDRITPAELARHGAILPPRGTYTRELIDQRLALPALKLKLETPYLETIKMMVGVGMGWGLLPENLLEHEGEPTMPAGAREITVERELGIVRHPRRTLSNAARAFIECCRECSEESR